MTKVVHGKGLAQPPVPVWQALLSVCVWGGAGGGTKWSVWCLVPGPNLSVLGPDPSSAASWPCDAAQLIPTVHALDAALNL